MWRVHALLTRQKFVCRLSCRCMTTKSCRVQTRSSSSCGALHGAVAAARSITHPTTPPHACCRLRKTAAKASTSLMAASKTRTAHSTSVCCTSMAARTTGQSPFKAWRYVKFVVSRTRVLFAQALNHCRLAVYLSVVAAFGERSAKYSSCARTNALPLFHVYVGRREHTRQRCTGTNSRRAQHDGAVLAHSRG